MSPTVPVAVIRPSEPLATSLARMPSLAIVRVNVVLPNRLPSEFLMTDTTLELSFRHRLPTLRCSSDKRSWLPRLIRMIHADVAVLILVGREAEGHHRARLDWALE